jgi:pimeloyl-ACP methyl ester carboxylesterase
MHSSAHLLNRRLPTSGIVAVLMFGLTFTAYGSDCSTSSCSTCLHSIPDLWVVNSRCAPRCTGLDAGFELLTYERWDDERRVFVRESRESFLAAQSNIPTLLFSHGNTLTHEAAMESCWKIRDRLRACPGRKLMVYWSWPAEILYTKPLIQPIKLLRKNIKAKYVYSEYQGYYIAKLTAMMSTAQPLTLGGHSYGGVTVICALHFLGGGQLNGLVLEGASATERPNLRAAIVSGALDNDSMYPGYRYGQTFAAVETFYTTYNDRDATLKRWPVHSFRGQEAAGYTGICASRLGPYAHKLFQQKLTEDVGTSHYIKPHLASNRMISAICQTAFPASECASCGCAACERISPTLPPPQFEVMILEDAEAPSSSDVRQLEVTAL